MGLYVVLHYGDVSFNTNSNELCSKITIDKLTGPEECFCTLHWTLKITKMVLHKSMRCMRIAGSDATRVYEGGDMGIIQTNLIKECSCRLYWLWVKVTDYVACEIL